MTLVDAPTLVALNVLLLALLATGLVMVRRYRATAGAPVAIEPPPLPEVFALHDTRRAANGSPSNVSDTSKPKAAEAAPATPSPSRVTRPRRETGVTEVGVLGCGYWGSKHVRVLSQQANVRVTAIDQDASRLDDLRGSFPGLETTSSLDEVVDDLDGLVIATPARSHADLAVRALEAGAHILVEKPLATSVDDAERVLRTAEAAGRTVTVGHTFEFNPAVWALREAVHDNDFGKIHYIDSARLNLGLYQSDVNVLWDLAPHDISIVLYLLGELPTSVCTWASSHVPGQHEDVAYLQMRFDHIDVTANIHVSWLDPAKVRRTTVVGSRQMAVYNDMSNERLRIFDKGVHDLEGPMHSTPITYREGDILSPYVDGREPLGLEIEAFIATIRGDDVARPDGRRGLEVVRVLEAAQQSIELGGRVDLRETVFA